MKQIEINSNDAGRRLDKFMRRYLPKATLSTIYKIIRKDVKVMVSARAIVICLLRGMF